MATTTFPTRDDFAALLNESLGGEDQAFEGKVVKGTVTGIENDMAVIDVGLKSEGRVPLREFAAPGQKAELKVGDEVEVYVDRVENSQGEAMLSRDRARREAAWDKLEGEFSAGNRVNHPNEVINIGDTVKVQIIRINRDTQRISLGMKQLEADPWEGAAAKYPVGGVFRGRVTNITEYGAFVELEPGIEGLVHVSEMSWTKKNVHPGKIVSTSQEVEVMVLDVDPVKRRISLGLKQCLDNPWTNFVDKYPVGTELQGDVKNITEFGLFVGLPGEIDGMVHLSDLSWDKPGEEAVQAYKKGDSVKVKVLDVDVEKERISLGIKQLQKDTFAEAATSLKKGDVVTCTVTAVVDGGIEVSVGDGLSGFIKKADLSRERSEQRPDRFAVGEKVDAKIVQVDAKTRKLTLSIKAREVEEDKQAMAEYGSSDSGASLGDILGAALNKAKKGKKDGDEA